MHKPRILFINTLESDGVQDLSYSGLAAVLGPERVIEYPWNSYYHLNRRRYPANLGYVQGSLLSSLRAKLHKNEFDYVLVAAAKPKCFQSYLSILDNIPARVPVVFLDGGDFSQPGGDLIRLHAEELYHQAIARRPFDAVFKRECLLSENQNANVWPLQFSFNYDRMPAGLPLTQKYQVAFWAVESNPIRTQALSIIEDKFDCRENGTRRNQVASAYTRRGIQYLRELAACNIVLNFPGVGWDTQRYWEVPALGRLLISMKPRIEIPNNFVHREHVVFCKDDLSDVVELCSYYLEHEAERERIALSGRDFTRAHHSNVARAQYIIEKLERLG